MTAALPRPLPHPWDLHVDQCRGFRCVWCKAVLGDRRVYAGTAESVHRHGSAPPRTVAFKLFSCPPCSQKDEP